MEVRRILMPVDGSPCSERAAEEALRLAKAFGAEVTALAVIDNPLRGIYGYSEGIGYYGDVYEALERSATSALARVERAATAAGVPVRTVLRRDVKPVDAILEAEVGHDLTVLGTHGRHGVDRVLLGSVTEGVLRRSDVPHLVVRCPPEPAHETAPDAAPG